MRKLALIGLLAVLAVGGAAQTPGDSARIYFRRGHRQVDTHFRNNRSELDRFVRAVREASGAGRLESIVIRSYASPDGTSRSNELLSARRADSLEAYIVRAAGIPADRVRTYPEGIGWGPLRALVAASDMRYRDEVLAVLDHTPVWVFDGDGRVVSGRKKELMDLRGGVPYRYMFEHIFPDIRAGLSAVLYVSSADSGQAPPPDSTASGDGAGRPLPDTLSGMPADTPPPSPARSEQVRAGAEPAAGPEPEPVQRLALKTNLIYDVLLMPSLEAEYRIGDRWSVNLEGEMAWWKNDGKHKYYQLATLSPEGRYWFGTKKPWHGHYVGLFGGFSWYDLENGGRGYQGEAEMVGLSYGYMFPVGRRLSFEAGVGVGYMHSKYEEYLPIDGHYVYQQTSRMDYFGPLKLKFALVWRLWNTGDSKKGGVR